MAGEMFAGRQIVYNPLKINMNGRDVSSAVESNAVGVHGMNQVTIEYEYSRGAGTTVTFYVQFRREGTSTWKRKKIWSTNTSGVTKLLDQQFDIDAGGADASGVMNFPVNFKGDMRLESVTATGSPTSADTFTAAIIVGVV